MSIYWNKILSILENQNKVILIGLLLYAIASALIWKKYGWNPSSQVNFGKEFCELNKSETPNGSIVFLGEKGDLGAGYDGQIFYFYSRMLSGFSLVWPPGFEESLRAPRIGYPLLASPFGWFGQYGTIFGMYLLNLGLMVISFLALRSILPLHKKYLSAFYLFSPFALGSYVLLVSDAVMISLVVLAYWAYKKEKYAIFIIFGSLAILTKEQALFLLFPLGVQTLWQREYRKSIFVLCTVFAPIAWALFLRIHFSEMKPVRYAGFFEPFEGIGRYLFELWESAQELIASDSEEVGFRAFAKKFSRFPLVLLLVSSCVLLFRGNYKKASVFRFGIALVVFTVFSGGYVLYWATYENISRMFTIAVPLLILWQSEDDSLKTWHFWVITLLVLFALFIKLAFISKPLSHMIWGT
ncbi:AZOBR_p60025 family cell surface glycopolymer formation protein [Leptospira perolatii]|uniref:AZOBR_p60025 family cell surface glycopolymer formation protein n=1 Tax=Leptospira perolatii TaxID=2023191 RepID=UPI0013FDBB00|nr:hypothetical protein [Leptospira perolatii]